LHYVRLVTTLLIFINPSQSEKRLVIVLIPFKLPFFGDSMKKLTFVATAVLGLLSTTAMAQSSVTLYGIVDAAVVHTTNQVGGSKIAVDAGQLATSRWGMKGSEDLGGGLKANFTLEGTLINDTGAAGLGFGGGTPAGTTTSLFDRQATVGFSGGFGSVNVGRQNILGVDSIGLADPISLAHAGTNPNVAFSALNAGALYSDYGTNGGGAALRQNNSIKYLTPNMSGFGGALMYGFGEQPGNSSANSYAGISGYFTDGKSGAALAYAQLKNKADNSTLTLWGGGAKYALNTTLTLRATYAQNEVDTTNRKIAVTGLGVDYAVSPAVTLTGAYYNTKRSGDVSGKAEQYVALGKYALSKRTILYASLTHAKAGSAAAQDTSLGLITQVGNTTANRTAVGVLHSF
jgi:predicted porin